MVTSHDTCTMSSGGLSHSDIIIFYGCLKANGGYAILNLLSHRLIGLTAKSYTTCSTLLLNYKQIEIKGFLLNLLPTFTFF